MPDHVPSNVPVQEPLKVRSKIVLLPIVRGLVKLASVVVKVPLAVVGGAAAAPVVPRARTTTRASGIRRTSNRALSIGHSFVRHSFHQDRVMLPELRQL